MPEHPQVTDLEQLLMLAVLRLGTSAYGAAIQSEISEHAGRAVSLGSIHVTLSRLEERGLARSAMGAPLGVRGGKARRLYAVTPEGRTVLERARRVMERMWEGVPSESGA